MTDDVVPNLKKVQPPSEPPQPPSPSLRGLMPGAWPQHCDSPSTSDLATSSDRSSTIQIPHQPFDEIWSAPQLQPPWQPTQDVAPTTTSSPISTGLLQDLNNSTANTANRDIWHLNNVHIHLPHSHAIQGPSIPQLLQLPFSIFSYMLSNFTTFTAVTLDSSQHETPSTNKPPNSPVMTSGLAATYCPGPTVVGSENDSVKGADESPFQASEGINTESGHIEITLLDDLDMSARHQPRDWYRSPDIPDGLSLDGIYIRKIYPSGHGYPCPNPCPLGPPVRIGDIGELTSTGFTTLANLADCQLPALRGQLASLALSDVCHEPIYFPEGQSITGGVSVQEISHLPGSSIIKDITYRCLAPQGAALAVTSSAQLNALAADKTHRLRLWLCKHGMELMRFLDPDRTDPLYVVTGKVTSSSWATATYSESLPEADDSLILTHFLHNVPPYQWTKPGTTRNWSKSSATVINSQGERASDQCLFLRGFLLTPALEYSSRQPQHALNIDTGIPDPDDSKGLSNSNAARGTLGQGSSQFTHISYPSNQSSNTEKASEQGNLRIEDVPSLSSVDFYPSHQINKRLLELTNADLAITHDDDWRLILEGSCNPSMLGLREDTTASVSGSVGRTAEDMHPTRHPSQGDHTAAMGEHEESLSSASLSQSPHGLKGPVGVNAASRDETVHHHGGEAVLIKVLQRGLNALWSYLTSLRLWSLLSWNRTPDFSFKYHSASDAPNAGEGRVDGMLEFELTDFATDTPRLLEMTTLGGVGRLIYRPGIHTESSGDVHGDSFYSQELDKARHRVPQRRTHATRPDVPASPPSGQQPGHSLTERGHRSD